MHIVFIFTLHTTILVKYKMILHFLGILGEKD